MKQYAGVEDSPPRITNNENSIETLPTLNIKVTTTFNDIFREKYKRIVNNNIDNVKNLFD